MAWLLANKTFLAILAGVVFIAGAYALGRHQGADYQSGLDQIQQAKLQKASQDVLDAEVAKLTQVTEQYNALKTAQKTAIQADIKQHPTNYTCRPNGLFNSLDSIATAGNRQHPQK